MAGEALDEFVGFLPTLFAAEEHGGVHDGCVVEGPDFGAFGPVLDGGVDIAEAVVHAAEGEAGVAGGAVAEGHLGMDVEEEFFGVLFAAPGDEVVEGFGAFGVLGAEFVEKGAEFGDVGKVGEGGSGGVL